MTVEQNLAAVRRGYEAFGAGDMDTLMSLYADDAVHIIPGNSQVSGAHKGKGDIQALYGKLFELTGGTLRIHLDHVLSDGGNRVVAVHTSTLEHEGETIELVEALLFTFVDDKVKEIQDFFSDIELSDRIFS